MISSTTTTKVSGIIISITLEGQTAGSVIKMACKFAYAGGMVVTKQFSYTVGNTCAVALDDVMVDEPFFYPNPVQNTLYLKLTGVRNRVVMTNLLGQTLIDAMVEGNSSIDVSRVPAGLYTVRMENEFGTKCCKVLKQ